MADEQAKIDSNYRKTLTGVTDDAAAEIKRLLVDPTTGRLKVSATVSGGAFTGSGTVNQVAYWSGGSALSSSGSLYWNNTNGFLGLNNNTPGAILDIFASSGTAFSVRNAGGTLFTVGANGRISVGSALSVLEILPNGNIGIGTTAPSSILHLSSAQPTLTITSTNTANYSQILFYENGNGVGGFQAIGSTYSDAARRNLMEFTTAGASSAGIAFRTGSPTVENVRIDMAGNVGIGTTTPNVFKLQVNGNVGPDATTNNLGSVGTPWSSVFAGSLSVTSGGTLQGTFLAGTGLTIPAFTVRGIITPANTNDLGSSGSAFGTIFANSIALGTNPASSGPLRIPNANFITARNGANDGDVNMWGASVGNRVVAGADVSLGDNVLYGSTSDNGDLKLRTTASATKATSYVLIADDGGNVGIGTTHPADFKLQINGDVGPTDDNNNLGSSGSSWGTIFTNNLQVNQQAYFDAEYSNGSVSSGATITWANGNKQFIEMNQNATLAFGTPLGPCNVILRTDQGNRTGGVATWPSNVKWSGGSALSTGSNQIDVVAFYFNGSNYFGQIATNFAT